MLTSKEQRQASQCPVLALESLKKRRQGENVHDHVQKVEVYQRVRVGPVYCPWLSAVALLAYFSHSLRESIGLQS